MPRWNSQAICSHSLKLQYKDDLFEHQSCERFDEYWLVRGSNLWGVVLVSIYRERRNGRVRWEIGRVGSTRKVEAKKEKVITCWVQKANEEILRWSSLRFNIWGWIFFFFSWGSKLRRTRKRLCYEVAHQHCGPHFCFGWLQGNWLLILYF